jgi:hypothetical protein
MYEQHVYIISKYHNTSILDIPSWKTLYIKNLKKKKLSSLCYFITIHVYYSFGSIQNKYK